MCARREVALAQDLRDRLPQVLEALSQGRICLARARVFSDTLMPVADDGVARRIAYRLLPSAQQWTASQLRQRLLKEIVIADPQAAKARVERSIADRRVSLVSNDDTTACLSAIFLPPAKAAAAFERVDAIARGMKHDGDTRTLDQLRADVFCDLLAGVSPTSAPVLRAGVVELLVPLSTLTGQSDSPGHLAGYGPVIADIARQVADAQATQAGQTTQSGQAAADAAQTATSAQAAGGVVAPQPPTRWRYRVHNEDGMLLYHGTTRARPEPDVSQDGPDVSQDGPDVSQDGPDVSKDSPDVSKDSPDVSRVSAAHSDARGCMDREAEIPRVMPCHADSVAPGVVRIRPLTPHPPAQADPAARFPNAKMRDWIAARDSTCRAPGCTAPARSCDIDHTDDHAAGGATRDDNLGLLCRHHRVS